MLLAVAARRHQHQRGRSAPMKNICRQRASERSRTSRSWSMDAQGEPSAAAWRRAPPTAPRTPTADHCGRTGSASCSEFGEVAVRLDVRCGSTKRWRCMLPPWWWWPPNGGRNPPSAAGAAAALAAVRWHRPEVIEPALAGSERVSYAAAIFWKRTCAFGSLFLSGWYFLAASVVIMQRAHHTR